MTSLISNSYSQKYNKFLLAFSLLAIRINHNLYYYDKFMLQLSNLNEIPVDIIISNSSILYF